MKAWLKVFLFLLAFQIEVRVKASEPPAEEKSEAVFENPENCLHQHEEACVLKVRDEAFHFKFEKVKWHAVKDSMLERKTIKEWRFVKGQLWVEAAKDVTFATLHGSAKATHGEYWIVSADDKIYFRNISSDLEVTLRDGKTVQAPAGFQFWVSGLNSAAKSEYGMIEPIDMKKLLPVWNTLYTGDKKAFTAKVKALREGWGNLVETSSAIYREQTLRKIASIDEQKKNEADQIRKKQLEKERLRESYRARVFDR